MYAFDHGGWMFGGVMMLLWWVVPIALVIALAVLLARRAGKGAAERTALDMLKERYARGEIGKDEFEQKKRDLDSEPKAPPVKLEFSALDASRST